MIRQFTPTLFWDTDIHSVSETEHAAFIIQRVCMLGSWDDWLILKAGYGMQKIEKELLNARYLDQKTLNYFSIILNIPKDKFRCSFYQPSVQKHWTY